MRQKHIVLEGGRLPLESEYEYVSTNRGETLYPWGNEEVDGENVI